MPLYEYKCNHCGHADTEFFKMSTASDPRACPKCCVADSYVRQVSVPHTDLKEFDTPVELLSIAMEDHAEIEAFAKQCPDVDVSLDESDALYGVPVARTRKAKLQALKAAGFVETK